MSRILKVSPEDAEKYLRCPEKRPEDLPNSVEIDPHQRGRRPTLCPVCGARLCRKGHHLVGNNLVVRNYPPSRSERTGYYRLCAVCLLVREDKRDVAARMREIYWQQQYGIEPPPEKHTRRRSLPDAEQGRA